MLVTQSVFLPADANASAAQQSQLDGVLAEAEKAGFSIRVALIASTSDLGSITPLWGQPQSYAEFLGDELSLVYHGYVLVVMPAGDGLYRTGLSPTAERAALAGTRAPGSKGLVEGAIAAVQRLAAASGHALAAPTGRPAPSPSTASGSGATIPWIVFAIGGTLIAAAWAASLRARPLARGSRVG